MGASVSSIEVKTVEVSRNAPTAHSEITNKTMEEYFEAVKEFARVAVQFIESQKEVNEKLATLEKGYEEFRTEYNGYLERRGHGKEFMLPAVNDEPTEDEQIAIMNQERDAIEQAERDAEMRDEQRAQTETEAYRLAH